MTMHNRTLIMGKRSPMPEIEIHALRRGARTHVKILSLIVLVMTGACIAGLWKQWFFAVSLAASIFGQQCALKLNRINLRLDELEVSKR